MARTARVKASGEGTMRYHLISRANNRQFLFRKAIAKDRLMEMARRAAEFSGIELVVATVMDNHFHIVCKVVRTGEPVPQQEVVRRVRVLKGDKAADRLEERWSGYAAAGMTEELDRELDAYRVRMNDISAYMKTMKELYSIWFKREYGYVGSIWDGTFKSTMIEDGRYLETCRRYVMMNPIRAGIVTQAKDYRWTYVGCETHGCAGCLPAGKVPQISSGKVFGSEAFVRKWIAALGDKFRARRTTARSVGELGFATHGWRLAESNARAAAA